MKTKRERYEDGFADGVTRTLGSCVTDRDGQDARSLEHLQGRRAALQNAVQALDVAIDRLEHGDNREPGDEGHDDDGSCPHSCTCCAP